MAFYITLGATGVYDPTGSYIDSGWSVSGGIATHSPCNPGYINYRSTNFLVVGKTYVVTYEVLGYVSGGVKVMLGFTSGLTRTANGIYTETLVCTSDPTLQFYSDGALSIQKLTIYDQAVGLQPGITIAFFDGNQKKWGLTISCLPEYTVRFKDFVYAFKDGRMWLQNSNPVHNNFFGVQYNSQIKLIHNLEPTTEKLYYCMRVQSNRLWAAPNNGDIYIPPTEGKVEGMQSRLTKSRYKMLQGNYFADFLRNTLTPGFDTELDALFKGAELRGETLEITLTNDSTDEVILFEVDITTAKSMFTY